MAMQNLYRALSLHLESKPGSGQRHGVSAAVFSPYIHVNMFGVDFRKLHLYILQFNCNFLLFLTVSFTEFQLVLQFSSKRGLGQL